MLKTKHEANVVSSTGPVIPTILCGGTGTRLWPLSRAMYPKQFVRFADTSNGCLLSDTLRRLPEKAGFAAPILLCNNDHRFLVREETERNAVKPQAIILEPVARNTAPALAVAALAAVERTPSAMLVVMPSDHVIKDNAAFQSAVASACRIAEMGKFVLFGISPYEPHTGYGYIHRGPPLAETNGFDVAGFFEKPDSETARQYIADGNYFWNSGIFVLPARKFLNELAAFAPEILAAAKAGLAAAEEDLGFLRLDAQTFARSPNISVDYAVMERTRSAAMVSLDAGWNDVGSWSSLWDIAERDENGNYTHGEAVLRDTSDCYVRSEKALVSTIGVRNLVIVGTPDALLVADKSRAQDVALLVTELKRRDRKEHEQHLRSYRPWGFFETLNLGPRFQVKLLHVKPGGQLSLQMHHHRSEHWVVVQGTAKVRIGDSEKLVNENESVYITATQWHRLENPGKVPLEIIEVQIGTYLGEDDIIRQDDVYRRAPSETH